MNILTAQSSRYVQTSINKVNTDGSTLMLGTGVGTYFHLAKTNLIDLSVGPRLNCNFLKIEDKDASSYLDLGLDFPLNIDVALYKKFGIRLSAALLDLRYVHLPDYDENSIRTIKALGSTSISLGLFFQL